MIAGFSFLSFITILEWEFEYWKRGVFLLFVLICMLFQIGYDSIAAKLFIVSGLVDREGRFSQNGLFDP